VECLPRTSNLSSHRTFFWRLADSKIFTTVSRFHLLSPTLLFSRREFFPQRLTGQSGVQYPGFRSGFGSGTFGMENRFYKIEFSFGPRSPVVFPLKAPLEGILTSVWTPSCVFFPPIFVLPRFPELHDPFWWNSASW